MWKLELELLLQIKNFITNYFKIMKNESLIGINIIKVYKIFQFMKDEVYNLILNNLILEELKDLLDYLLHQLNFIKKH